MIGPQTNINLREVQLIEVKQNQLEDEASLIINTGTAEEQPFTEVSLVKIWPENYGPRYPEYWTYLHGLI